MNHWSLTHLDLIGFSSTIEQPTLPRILAPVFRVRADHTVVLLPPFSMVADEVFNFTLSEPEEFASFVHQQKLTRLREPFTGKTNHDLWVDVDGQVTYSPKFEVKKKFKLIFDEHLKLAAKKLVNREYEAARQDANIARAVNPSHIDPLVIRASAERLAGLNSDLAFTRHIAKNYISPDEFERLLQRGLGD